MHKHWSSATLSMSCLNEPFEALLGKCLLPAFSFGGWNEKLIVEPSKSPLQSVCTFLAEGEVPKLAPLRPLYDLVLQRGVHM